MLLAFTLMGRMAENMKKMDFPTANKFEEQLKKKKDAEEKRMKTIAWKELAVGDIYRIDGASEIDGYSQFAGGNSMLLDVTSEAGLKINVWATSLIAKEVRGDGWNKNKVTFPCYVKPMGMKKCKNDAQRQYHAFKLLSEEEMMC